MAIWPKKLKLADIKPIPKEGDEHLLTNYRPISSISNLAKIYDKRIYNRIYSFVSKQKILSVKQFGFINKLGTKDALSKITTLLLNKIDQKEPTTVAFLDLAKAFVTIDYQILLNKLNICSIRAHALNRIKSYLTDRKQTFEINDTQSSYQKIKTSVPQGTILGPFLFILYIKELLSALPVDSVFSYADDINTQI